MSASRPVVDPALPWRSWMVLIGLSLVWAVLIGRLIQVQGVQQSRFASRASRQQIHTEKVPARPGDLLDRQGRLLATSITTQSLYVNPARVADPLTTACALAEALGIDPVDLHDRLNDSRNKRFLWIKRRLSDSEVERVLAAQLPKVEWGFQQEYLRVYPQGPLAAHVLGWRDIDGVPHSGVEESLNAALVGVPGERQVVRDARGFVIDLLEDDSQPAQPGQNLTLTLDIAAQYRLERHLDGLMTRHAPVGACAAIMDPSTGEILAMASRPAFDPTHPELAPENSWRNLLIQAAYEPGSTVKPIVVAAALDRGFIREADSFDCERGAYRMGPRVLHDHHRYGVLSLKDVLVKSSNIGMAKIGEKLANPALHDVLSQFGFGRRTGIELPGELEGTLHPLSRWTIYSTGSIPMGQEMMATPLQVLAAHAALANRGVARSPHLVMESALSPGASANLYSSQVVGASSARWVVEQALVEVVQRGTGTKAQIENATLFGKTGTSQKMAPDGTYSHTRHISSFVCGAPAEAPRVVAIVTVDEPTRGGSDYGGIVAAPVAAAIVADTLKLLDRPQ
jgi:cell division protein FtsI (penicillin-binding protein 3)